MAAVLQMCARHGPISGRFAFPPQWGIMQLVHLPVGRPTQIPILPLVDSMPLFDIPDVF